MKRNYGFTVVELLTAAIICILAAILLSGTRDIIGVYGYIMSEDVNGHLESVSLAKPAGGIIGSDVAKPVFQVVVVTNGDNGANIKFSTDDYRWASYVGERAQGRCVQARIYPYAPWHIGKTGLYYSGQRFSVNDCASQ